MKSIRPLQVPFAIVLAMILTIPFSCSESGSIIAGLSMDTLNVADSKMKAYVDQGQLPCVATLILKDGTYVRRASFGFANIEEQRKLPEDAIFRVYSMSKPITAAALMMLYDEGMFHLDDPVSRYIPEFAETPVWVDGKAVPQQEPFTIRHLLTHTAGFCYGWDTSHVDSLYAQAASEGIWSSSTLADMVRLLATIPLKNQPGTVYEYSVSMDVAGYLVEVLSGLPFDVFLQTRMFDPLGMKETGFEVPEADFDRLAMIYTRNGESGKLTPVESMTNGVKQKVTLFSGGGGLVSTLDDYGKFGQMLINGGELDGVRILQESTVRMIMSPQMPENVSYEEGFRYGLGGQVNLTTGEYGWSGAASTDFVADPKNNMVILSFTQYTPFMGVPFAAEYKALVRNALVETEGSATN